MFLDCLMEIVGKVHLHSWHTHDYTYIWAFGDFGFRGRYDSLISGIRSPPGMLPGDTRKSMR